MPHGVHHLRPRSGWSLWGSSTCLRDRRAMTPRTKSSNPPPSGIVQTGQSSVRLIKERSGSETRRVGVNGEFDGWTVKQMGEDFAVVTHNGEEVRLILSKERI